MIRDKAADNEPEAGRQAADDRYGKGLQTERRAIVAPVSVTGATSTPASAAVSEERA